MFKKMGSISDKAAYTLFGLILGMVGGVYPSVLIASLEREKKISVFIRKEQYV